MPDEVKIDPAKVPGWAWDQACRVLQACVERALADPKLRKEYEAWKEQYRAERKEAEG